MKTLSQHRLKVALGGLALSAMSWCAQAQNICGSPFVQPPQLLPQMAPTPTAQSNAAIDCFMWQSFVYLTWPALAGQPGLPNTAAPYGMPSPTVWETFKSYDEVFLPNAAVPAPWNSSATKVNAQKKLLQSGTRVNHLSLRLLRNKTKVFQAAKNFKQANANIPLSEIVQVKGGSLYDQTGQAVYYEMLLNQTEFDYIMVNKLYNANAQYGVAQKNGLVLPANSIEVKAAWKVLSPAELAVKPVRFFTAQALLGTNPKPVIVGLVGLHFVQFPSATSFYQGFWATFSQIDNAPTQNQTGASGPWSFYNAACATAQCPVNTPPTPAGQPTQVVQMFGAAQEAQGVNTYMQQLIAQQAPASPAQFYQLIDVQWPTSAVAIGKANQLSPLANGSPNTTTLMNPVLETFIQKNTVSCLGCHTNASVAAPSGITNPQNYASSFSFLMGHAQSPRAKALKQLVRTKKPAP